MSYVIVGLEGVDDYGAGFDGAKNYREGEEHISFLLTGEFDRDVIKDHSHGALGFMLGDLTRRVLSHGLRSMDPVPARHVVLPFLVGALGLAVFAFVCRYWVERSGSFRWSDGQGQRCEQLGTLTGRLRTLRHRRSPIPQCFSHPVC